MYKKIFKSILNNSGLTGLYKNDENAVFSQKPHFLFSAENPMYPENHVYNLKHHEVVSMLKGKGYKVEEVNGHYGKPERSILVHNPPQHSIPHLLDLSKKLGQESSIYSDGYNHEMHFHGGPNAGLHIKGQGTTYHKRKPDDHFTEMANGKSFTHVFNFDEAHDHNSSMVKEPDLSTKKSEIDFVKSEPNHPLINAGPHTKLIHFSTQSGLKDIDPNFQGQRIKDASSKYGKPEHPVSFFYLEGAKPEALVTNGSTSKYVARLGHHKVYDLGTDPENIKKDLREKSMNRQINPGSFTRDELDAAIKAKGYGGIYNSQHEIEDMRKVVGMYHKMPVEKEVAYHPRDAEMVTDAAHEVHHSLNKSTRRFFVDEQELEDIEKAGTSSASKHIGLGRLKQIQADHNLGANGKDYDAGELKDAINERSNSQAQKMVRQAGKQEKEMAARAAAGPQPIAFPPPMPRKPGVGIAQPTPISTHNPAVRAVADSYAQSRGLKLNHNIPQSKVDPENAKKIADAYHNAQHMPNDPHVKSAYDALINETKDQYAHMLKNGLKVSKIQPGQENPYKTSKDLFNDIKNNNHIFYFPTDQGFGSGESGSDHPLLQPTEHLDAEGKPMAANDIFRIVHDYFGHAKEGNGFGPNGEEGAWKHHMQMYSPLAQKALTAETRGQNSWVNFGPHGEENRKNPANTKYADQKATILPDFAHQHGEQSVYSQLGMKKSELMEKGLNGNWQKEGGYLFHHRIRNNANYGFPVHEITVTHASDGHKKPIGSFTFATEDNKNWFSTTSLVHRSHQRKGIANSAYQLAEEKTGGQLIPSEEQSDAALDLWNAQEKRPFGKKELSGKHSERLSLLMKGAMNRMAPYNPDKHISAEDHRATENWTSEGDDQDARSNVPEMHANAKVRALHKMTGMTEVRRHPKTGERMYLLHRGMGEGEYMANHKGGKSQYAPGTLTSWTPKYSVAKDFAGDHLEGKKPRVVSAWIPESHIHNVPNQTMIPDENAQFRNEHEVIVNHQGVHLHAHPDLVAVAKNPRLLLDNKINMKGQAEQARRQDEQDPRIAARAFNRQIDRAKRAEEYKRNKFGKREVISMKTLAKGDISSKIRNGVAGLAVAAAAMNPMNSVTDKQPDVPAITQQQPAPVNKRKERILSSIMDVESSGGRNTKHKAMPANHALHQGERAYGSYGLMPLIIRETLKKHPELGKVHAKALNLTGDKMHEYMNKNPGLEKQIAEAHYDRLAKQFGDNPQKIGYAWLNGVTGTWKALKDNRPLDKHYYVKRILKAYGDKKAQGK